MGKPGKKPEKSMAQVIAERDRQAQQNIQKRAEKLDRLVENIEAPNAMFLLQDKRNLHAFTEQHGIKITQLDLLKTKLQQRARQ